MAVVHWPVTIPKERQREFEDVLASFVPEYSGILNWLIAGALRFIESGLPEPKEVVSATQEYRNEMDPVVDFVNECVHRLKGEKVKRSALYEAYAMWAYGKGRRPVSRPRFQSAFMARGFGEVKDSEMFYTDCQLHDVSQGPQPPIDFLARDDQPSF